MNVAQDLMKNDWITLDHIDNNNILSYVPERFRSSADNADNYRTGRRYLEKVINSSIILPIHKDFERKFSGKSVIQAHLETVAKNYESIINSSYSIFSYLMGLLHDVEDKDKSKNPLVMESHFHNPLHDFFPEHKDTRILTLGEQIIIGMNKEEIQDNFLRLDNLGENSPIYEDSFEKDLLYPQERILHGFKESYKKNLNVERKILEELIFDLHNEIDKKNKIIIPNHKNRKYSAYIMNMDGRNGFPIYFNFPSSNLLPLFLPGLKFCDQVGNVDNESEFNSKFFRRKYSEIISLDISDHEKKAEIKRYCGMYELLSQKEFMQEGRRKFNKNKLEKSKRIIVYGNFLWDTISRHPNFEMLYDVGKTYSFFQNNINRSIRFLKSKGAI